MMLHTILLVCDHRTQIHILHTLEDVVYPCMEDDGFFLMSGIDKMIETMNRSLNPEEQENPKVVPQDHKKPNSKTSTK